MPAYESAVIYVVASKEKFEPDARVKVTLGATKAVTVPCKHDRKNSYYGFTANLPRSSSAEILASDVNFDGDVGGRAHQAEIRVAEDLELEVPDVRD
jgi:hypothetical protein